MHNFIQLHIYSWDVAVFIMQHVTGAYYRYTLPIHDTQTHFLNMQTGELISSARFNSSNWIIWAPFFFFVFPHLRLHVRVLLSAGLHRSLPSQKIHWMYWMTLYVHIVWVRGAGWLGLLLGLSPHKPIVVLQLLLPLLLFVNLFCASSL